MKEKNDLAERKFIIASVAVIIVGVYIIRLFTLQITSDDYKKSADSNAFLKKVDFPSRGNITDRNGKLLVFNQPAYDIMVVMNEAKDHLDTLDLCKALNITREEFDRRMATAPITNFLSARSFFSFTSYEHFRLPSSKQMSEASWHLHMLTNTSNRRS